MSHFSVLVIGDDVDGQLAPYDENISVAPYKEGEVSTKDKKRFRDCYEKLDPSFKSLSFEALYDLKGSDWNGKRWKKVGKKWEEWSTYNPNSKWDWYSKGGRWAGEFKLKEGKKGEIGDCSTFERIDAKAMKEYEKKMETKVDIAKKGDIDFTPDKEDVERAKRFWELYIEGKKPKTEEDKEMLKYNMYKKDYYIKEYKTKEEYVKRETEFGTFAVVKDGIWYEKGRMGWFGCSFATHKQSQKWDKSFFNKWIKPLSDDTTLTIVDCHI